MTAARVLARVLVALFRVTPDTFVMPWPVVVGNLAITYLTVAQYHQLRRADAEWLYPSHMVCRMDLLYGAGSIVGPVRGSL